MRTVLLLFACVAACSGDADDAGGAAPLAARWEIDEEANLAVPVCAGCGEVLDRGAQACTGCSKPFVIEAKTIPCPECAGAKACVHCTPCPACKGGKECSSCEGSGLRIGLGGGPDAADRGDVEGDCPDCDGAGECTACAEACERCAGGGTCANCEGTGSITLR